MILFKLSQLLLILYHYIDKIKPSKLSSFLSKKKSTTV